MAENTKVLAGHEPELTVEEAAKKYGVPTVVVKYARSQGLPLTHPRIIKYAASMSGRVADGEFIEEGAVARPAVQMPEWAKRLQKAQEEMDEAKEREEHSDTRGH